MHDNRNKCTWLQWILDFGFFLQHPFPTLHGFVYRIFSFALEAARLLSASLIQSKQLFDRPVPCRPFNDYHYSLGFLPATKILPQPLNANHDISAI